MGNVVLLGDCNTHVAELETVLHHIAGVTAENRMERDLASLRQRPCDVIVACYREEQSARGLVPRLRVLKPKAKILVILPFASQVSERHVVGLGADDVLRWPVTRARLEVTLRNLLRMAALEVEGGTFAQRAVAS